MVVESVSWSTSYEGCYRFSPKLLPKGPKVLPGKGISACVSYCLSKNYPISGVMGNKCYCGKKFPKLKRLSESECRLKCKDNQNSMCGGKNAFSIFSATSTTSNMKLDKKKLQKPGTLISSTFVLWQHFTN